MVDRTIKAYYKVRWSSSTNWVCLIDVEPFRDPLFEALSDEEQMVYFDWMETLQLQGWIPLELNDEDFMDMIYRMYRCDISFNFDAND